MCCPQARTWASRGTDRAGLFLGVCDRAFLCAYLGASPVDVFVSANLPYPSSCCFAGADIGHSSAARSIHIHVRTRGKNFIDVILSCKKTL